jgi:hypothetical protein
MSLYIESKRKAEKTIRKQHPEAGIIDVTSQGEWPFVKLSPFYPHQDIPIPFSEGYVSCSVEGIWQGLKVFERADVDFSVFANGTMKGLKRTVRKFGTPVGHRKGVYGTELLTYIEARKQIFLPAYRWILENKLIDVLAMLKKVMLEQDLILLDYETNGDINNPDRPLSHAYLVKYYLEERYPS